MKRAVFKPSSPIVRQQLLERCDQAISTGRRIRETLGATFERAIELREQIETLREDNTSYGHTKSE